MATRVSSSGRRRRRRRWPQRGCLLMIGKAFLPRLGPLGGGARLPIGAGWAWMRPWAWHRSWRAGTRRCGDAAVGRWLRAGPTVGWRGDAAEPAVAAGPCSRGSHRRTTCRGRRRRRRRSGPKRKSSRGTLSTARAPAPTRRREGVQGGSGACPTDRPSVEERSI